LKKLVFIGYKPTNNGNMMVNYINNWLVVWNHGILCSPVVGMMIQSDELIFFRGAETTNQICIGVDWNRWSFGMFWR
jgi:hypothetical protein